MDGTSQFLSKFEIPFSNIPRNKTEAVLLDTPSIKVYSTLKIILTELFSQFFSKSGKYRQYINLIPNLTNYALDADQNVAENKFSFQVWNQELSREIPCIQFVLGNPIPSYDLNTGYERGLFAREHHVATMRNFYKVNCSIFNAAHSASVASELGSLIEHVIGHCIPAVFGRAILSPDQDWQLCFPIQLQLGDGPISRREEVRAAFEQVFWQEHTCELLFEKILYVGNQLSANLGNIEIGKPVPPKWVGPVNLTVGQTQIYNIVGRQDAKPIRVVSTNDVVRVTKVNTFTYELWARKPGTFKLQAAFTDVDAAILEITVTK